MSVRNWIALRIYLGKDLAGYDELVSRVDYIENTLDRLEVPFLPRRQRASETKVEGGKEVRSPKGIDEGWNRGRRRRAASYGDSEAGTGCESICSLWGLGLGMDLGVGRLARLESRSLALFVAAVDNEDVLQAPSKTSGKMARLSSLRHFAALGHDPS